MTERLYYDQPYLTRFTATVTGCEKAKNGFELYLDRSAFYPTSGGQPYDTGTIGSVRVLDVEVTKTGDVVHTVDTPVETGTQVDCAIDWDRRFDFMQQHAGDHMIAGALYHLLNGTTIGLHIGENDSTIDVEMPEGRTRLTDAEIEQVELWVNRRIWQDVPIRCWFPEPEELEKLPLRKPPTVKEHIRIVAVGEDEMVACGGTHPSSAGQLGLVKILSTTPARGLMRVSFVSGARALRQFRNAYAITTQTANALTTSAEKIPSAVDGLQQELKETREKLNRLLREKMILQVEEAVRNAKPLQNGATLISAIYDDIDAAMLRDMASTLIKVPDRIALLGCRAGDRVNYVFACSDNVPVQMGQLLSSAAKACGGKGGGRPTYAQGGGPEAMLAIAKAQLETM